MIDESNPSREQLLRALRSLDDERLKIVIEACSVVLGERLAAIEAEKEQLKREADADRAARLGKSDILRRHRATDSFTLEDRIFLAGLKVRL